MGLSAIERLRRTYRPVRITLLLVGESAPAGGTFFYRKNSTLYFESQAAFTAALPGLFRSADFLEMFRLLGCYLDDLCLEPVNHLHDRERKQRRSEAEPRLARRLRRYRPKAVVAVGKTTAAPHVRAALERSDLEDVSFAEVPFPGRPAHKAEFQREMQWILRKARRTKVIGPP